MNHQIYGREPRPKLDDAWIKKYNTRWIGPRTFETQQADSKKTSDPYQV